MNSYFIFAIVLTVAYIIYYAVIIAHDIYGKKGTDKPNEEVFDLGAPEEEESVAVTESETGFSIGSENYETESTATSSETSCKLLSCVIYGSCCSERCLVDASSCIPH